MLGEFLGETRGKIDAHRVLPADGNGPKVEATWHAAGTLAGVEVTELGTYESVVTPAGTLFGSGQGVLIGKGGEMITWIGQGAGRLKLGGGASFRGAIYHQTAAPGLARLNGIAAVFEYEEDAEGNTHAKLWEWK